jgi:hypothetical protein
MQKKIWIAAALLLIGSGLSGCVEVYDPFNDWGHHGESRDHGSRSHGDDGGHRHGD